VRPEKKVEFNLTEDLILAKAEYTYHIKTTIRPIVGGGEIDHTLTGPLSYRMVCGVPTIATPWDGATDATHIYKPSPLYDGTLQSDEHIPTFSFP